MSDTLEEIDVREIEPKHKHPIIFEKFDNLNDGEAFIIINDHDPKPIKYELAAERANEKFIWKYLEKGPNVWKVRIGKTD